VLKSRAVVFFINPPNSNDLGTLSADGKYVSKGIQHTDWANFPHLGILSLASYIDLLPGLESIYIDGVIHDLDAIVAAVSERAHRTFAKVATRTLPWPSSAMEDTSRFPLQAIGSYRQR